MIGGARTRILVLAFSDALVLVAALAVAGVLSRWIGGSMLAWANIAKLWPFLFFFWGCNGCIRLYHGNIFYPGAPLDQIEELRRMFFSVSFTYLLVWGYWYLAVDASGGRWLLLSWFFSIVLMPPARWAARKWMKMSRVGQMRVLIAGAGRTGQRLAEAMRSELHFGFEPVGFLDDAAKTSVPVLGSVTDAVAVARRLRVDYLICCLPLPVVQRNLRDYVRHFIHIMIIPDNQVFPISWSYPTNLHGTAGLELRNQLLLPGPRLLKAGLEMVVALMAILVLCPLFLLLALLVKLTSPGPVFYRARRIGWNGQPIAVWKFRSMFADADTRLETLLAENPQLESQWRKSFKLDRDPRVTRLGRLMRKTSLDELPQLFNVLCGEMAVIGPRPIVDEEKTYYASNYEVFSRVKPGITGLWQVSGRSETDYDKRVELDMYYIMNWSIWLDLYIMFKTVLEVLRCRGAK